MNMELVGKFYLELQNKQIERAVKSWDFFLGIYGPREKKRSNTTVESKEPENTPLPKSIKSEKKIKKETTFTKGNNRKKRNWHGHF